jgi:P-type Ca2+ transporter type 2C
LALGFDKAEKDSMKNPPRNTRRGIFRKSDIVFIMYHGIIMAGLMLAVFFIELYLEGGSLEKARTMAFAMLVLVQLTQAFNAKSTESSLFRRDLFSNRGLVAAVLLSFILLLAGMYLPFLSGVFEQVELHVQDWLELGAGVMVFILFAEVFKLLKRSI